MPDTPSAPAPAPAPTPLPPPPAAPPAPAPTGPARPTSAAEPAAASPRVVRRRNWVPSLIWLIPIVAAFVGITLVARNLMNDGPEIVLTFETANGLEAGKTAVRYKDVQIGVVKHIRLANDRSHVRVLTQLNKDASDFLTEDSRYWVVRPRLDTSGISGLNTLLSGAYIGADPGTSKTETDEFEGLEAPPIVTSDASGLQFTLNAADLGSLDIGSPVYFRRIKVGQVAAFQLDQEGKSVTLSVFVNKPYAKFVGANTRFWHASGLDVDIGASGLKLRTQSLATILLGGIAFAAPEDDRGDQAQENARFTLAPDEASAMKEPDGAPRTVLLQFNQSIRGLSVGAPVDFRGINIGEVKSIGVLFDRSAKELLMSVEVHIYPERLRRRVTDKALEAKYSAEDRLEFLVSKGLRAQLRTGNLLTGQAYVALDFFPKAKPVKVDLNQKPLELPTMPGSLDEITGQVQEIAAKINKLPLEEIGNDLRKSLATLNKTLDSAGRVAGNLDKQVMPQITAAMKDARKTLSTAERTLAEDSPVQTDLRQTLQELTRAARSIKTLTDYLERHPESLLRGKPDDKR